MTDGLTKEQMDRVLAALRAEGKACDGRVPFERARKRALDFAVRSIKAASEGKVYDEAKEEWVEQAH